jgi:hypothetical protein
MNLYRKNLEMREAVVAISLDEIKDILSKEGDITDIVLDVIGYDPESVYNMLYRLLEQYNHLLKNMELMYANQILTDSFSDKTRLVSDQELDSYKQIGVRKEVIAEIISMLDRI